MTNYSTCHMYTFSSIIRYVDLFDFYITSKRNPRRNFIVMF